MEIRFFNEINRLLYYTKSNRRYILRFLAKFRYDLSKGNFAVRARARAVRKILGLDIPSRTKNNFKKLDHFDIFMIYYRLI